MAFSFKGEAMKKLLAVVTVAGLVAMLSGCSMPQMAPVFGGLYMNVKGPVAVGDAATDAKTGTVESKSICGVAWGDSSISAAMKRGGIKKIHHVDTDSFCIMGVYATSKTIVYGE